MSSAKSTKENKKISLGYKELQPKPWATADERYPVGSFVEGKVVRIVPFGAFVSLEPTIDGLIHISQVGIKRVAKVEDELAVGDRVRCKVVEVDTSKRRISLSRREALIEENPEEAERIMAEEREQRERERAERNAERNEKRQQEERPAASRQQHAKSVAVSAMSVVQNAAAVRNPITSFLPLSPQRLLLHLFSAMFVASNDNE